MFDKIDQLGVNTIRTLSIEAVQKANSGHPGLPMGATPMAYALWTKHLKVNPTTSKIGLTVTVLSYPQDMVRQCYTAYYIYQVIKSQSMT